jgi:hypothetical protein
MLKVPLFRRIGNAAAVLLGSHGDVAEAARQAGCSRQSVYDHAGQVQQALEEAQLPGPSRSELLTQVEQLRQDNAALRVQLAQRGEFIEFNQDRRQRLSATTSAMGLSLNQISEIFAVLLTDQPPCVACQPAPSRATIGRWVLTACVLAGVVLRLLDERSRASVRVLCLDEIFFHGKPVLVAVEPLSMAVLHCHKAPDRTGQTWQAVLQPFTRLEHAVADAGSGLQAGLQAVQQQRRQSQATPQPLPLLSVGLDVFHIDKEAQVPLGQSWRRVEACWEAAEKAEQRARQAEEANRDLCGPRARMRAAQRRLQWQWDFYEEWENGWKRAKAALGLFRPDGKLNDRSWATREIEAACEVLSGPRWQKVRSMLRDQRTLAFLDRVHRQLGEAEADGQLREALVELWRLEQRGGQAATAQSVAQLALCKCLAEDWQKRYARVSEVLAGVVRASSAVECVNSVLRMQQGRHRNVSQEMLDLKRLYWNTRVIQQGKREGKCPYQHLGLSLPTYDFWKLLHADPGKLAQELSSQPVTH